MVSAEYELTPPLTEYKVARECEAANVIGPPQPACKEQLLAQSIYRAMSVVYLNSPITRVSKSNEEGLVGSEASNVFKTELRKYDIYK